MRYGDDRGKFLNAVGDFCYGGGFCFGREDDEGRCQPCASHPHSIAPPIGRTPSARVSRLRNRYLRGRYGKGRGLMYKGLKG